MMSNTALCSPEDVSRVENAMFDLFVSDLWAWGKKNGYSINCGVGSASKTIQATRDSDGAKMSIPTDGIEKQDVIDVLQEKFRTFDDDWYGEDKEAPAPKTIEFWVKAVNTCGHCVVRCGANKRGCWVDISGGNVDNFHVDFYGRMTVKKFCSVKSFFRKARK